MGTKQQNEKRDNRKLDTKWIIKNVSDTSEPPALQIEYFVS